MVKITDYYATLGVEERATQENIKRAYRTLALQHHPDRQPPHRKQKAEERFKAISEAYYVLSDRQRRQEYDAARTGGAFRGVNGFDVEEFMRYFRGGQTARSSGFHVFDGNLTDLFGGAGTPGQGPRQTVIFSDEIDGLHNLGETAAIQTDLETTATVSRGTVVQGVKVRLRTPKGKTLIVDVPRTVKDGQRLRLREQGNICPCCGKPGDLYVQLKIN